MFGPSCNREFLSWITALVRTVYSGSYSVEDLLMFTRVKTCILVWQVVKKILIKIKIGGARAKHVYPPLGSNPYFIYNLGVLFD